MTDDDITSKETPPSRSARFSSAADVDRLLTRLHRIRAELSDPDSHPDDATTGRQLDEEQRLLELLAEAPATTLEGMMHKFALLSHELAEIPVPRHVRLLAEVAAGI